MLILGLEDPGGTMHYIAGAFPSACGKTNLAMLVPPDGDAGLEGDGPSATISRGCGRAPTAGCGRSTRKSGFFGVVPGTSRKTNPTAFDMIQRNTIYTNVALRPDGTPWWEGHDDPAAGARRSTGRDGRGRRRPRRRPRIPTAASPTPATQCASLSPEFDNPEGRADRRDPLRRAPAAPHAARLRGARTGSTARSSAPRCRRRRPPPRPARSACCAAIRWRCGRSAATTWRTTSRTGSTSAPRLTKPPQHLPRQLVPHRRERTLPLARLRRQPARAEVDPRALRRPRRSRSRPRSARVPTLDAIDRTGLTCRTRT